MTSENFRSLTLTSAAANFSMIKRAQWLQSLILMGGRKGGEGGSFDSINAWHTMVPLVFSTKVSPYFQSVPQFFKNPPIFSHFQKWHPYFQKWPPTPTVKKKFLYETVLFIKHAHLTTNKVTPAPPVHPLTQYIKNSIKTQRKRCLHIRRLR